MSKKRGTVAKYVSYGGREIKAIVNGKETGISQEKNGVFYFLYDDPKTGKRRKKTCTNDIQIAYSRFMQFVDGQRQEEYITAKGVKQVKKIRKQYENYVTQIPLPEGLNIRKDFPYPMRKVPSSLSNLLM